MIVVGVDLGADRLERPELVHGFGLILGLFLHFLDTLLHGLILQILRLGMFR